MPIPSHRAFILTAQRLSAAFSSFELARWPRSLPLHPPTPLERQQSRHSTHPTLLRFTCTLLDVPPTAQQQLHELAWHHRKDLNGRARRFASRSLIFSSTNTRFDTAHHLTLARTCAQTLLKEFPPLGVWAAHPRAHAAQHARSCAWLVLHGHTARACCVLAQQARAQQCAVFLFSSDKAFQLLARHT
jgi:hypothetical protein